MLTPIFSDAELSDCDRVTPSVTFAQSPPVRGDGHPADRSADVWPCRTSDVEDDVTCLPPDDDRVLEDDADVRDLVVRLRGLQERRTAAVGKWLVSSGGAEPCRLRRSSSRRRSDCRCRVTTDEVVHQPGADDHHQFDSMDVVGNEVLSLGPDDGIPTFVAAPGAAEMASGDGATFGRAARDGGGQPGAEERMNGALHRLRQELASLLSQDSAIFDQLLALRRSIAHIKHQSTLLEEWEDDAEVTYLSSSLHTTGSVRRSRLQRANSVRTKCRRRDSGAPLISADDNHHRHCDQDCCPTSGEDSAFSLESSSPSLSPSPTSSSLPIATVAPSSSQKLQQPAQAHDDDDDDASFTRNNVTFPPSRNRQSRFNSLGGGRSCSLSTFGVDQLGCRQTDIRGGGGGGGVAGYQRGTSVGGATTNGLPHYPSPMSSSFSLVRSRSITFLPRGALVRREESCDSGFDGAPSRGEVFV